MAAGEEQRAEDARQRQRVQQLPLAGKAELIEYFRGGASQISPFAWSDQHGVRIEATSWAQLPELLRAAGSPPNASILCKVTANARERLWWGWRTSHRPKRGWVLMARTYDHDGAQRMDVTQLLGEDGRLYGEHGQVADPSPPSASQLFILA